MIHFKLYDNPLALDDLNLASSLSALTPQERAKIESVRVLQVEEKAHFQRDLISVFRDFLAFCGQEHHVYLVLLEAYPQPRSGIRSKKGLLYRHKGALDKSAVFETEIEVSPGETLLAGMIRISEQNRDYLLDCFDDLPLAFAWIAPRNKKTFRTNRRDFLEAIVLEGLKPGKIYWKNWLKLVATLVKPGSKLCSLQDLNGTEHLRVFHHKGDAEWGHDLERFISQALAAGPVFQD